METKNKAMVISELIIKQDDSASILIMNTPYNPSRKNLFYCMLAIIKNSLLKPL